MIINNKYLNSKPTYILPDGVEVIEWRNKSNIIGIPDLCINTWGTVRIGTYKEVSHQLYIYSKDKLLVKYLTNYDWGTYTKIRVEGGITPGLYKWQVEKIISDYYRGVEDDNK